VPTEGRRKKRRVLKEEKAPTSSDIRQKKRLRLCQGVAVKKKKKEN